MKKELDEKQLEYVNGGSIEFTRQNTVLSYHNEENDKITLYDILDYDKAIEIMNRRKYKREL